MLKIAVCVSGGGTNLQAIIDGIEQKTITNTEIAVVISNNPGAYALERAKKHGIEAVCISPKEYESRAAFNEDFLRRLDAYEVDLVVLAGFLVVIPEQMIAKYRNRIINIHPSAAGTQGQGEYHKGRNKDQPVCKYRKRWGCGIGTGK